MSIDFLDIASCINVLTNSTGQTVTTTETISAVYATVLYIFVVVCGCLHCRCGSFVANGSAAHADLRRRISDRLFTFRCAIQLFRCPGFGFLHPR